MLVSALQMLSHLLYNSTLSHLRWRRKQNPNMTIANLKNFVIASAAWQPRWR